MNGVKQARPQDNVGEWVGMGGGTVVGLGSEYDGQQKHDVKG